jgi:ABC-2 type transport system permease protein
MPRALQWIAVLIPLKYYLTIIRSLLIKGVGVDSLVPEIFALMIFGVSFILLAAMRLQKRLD